MGFPPFLDLVAPSSKFKEWTSHLFQESDSDSLLRQSSDDSDSSHDSLYGRVMTVHN